MCIEAKNMRQEIIKAKEMSRDKCWSGNPTGYILVREQVGWDNKTRESLCFEKNMVLL